MGDEHELDGEVEEAAAAPRAARRGACRSGGSGARSRAQATPPGVVAEQPVAGYQRAGLGSQTIVSPAPRIVHRLDALGQRRLRARGGGAVALGELAGCRVAVVRIATRWPCDASERVEPRLEPGPVLGDERVDEHERVVAS